MTHKAAGDPLERIATALERIATALEELEYEEEVTTEWSAEGLTYEEVTWEEVAPCDNRERATLGG